MSTIATIRTARIPGHGHECTCPACREQRRRYNIGYEIDVAAHGPRTVDATPARERLEQWAAYGWTFLHIASATGVEHAILLRVANGAQRNIYRETHERLMTRAPSYENATPRTWVPGFGARRRVEALMAIGHSRDTILSHLPTRVNFDRLKNVIHAQTWWRIAAVYDDLCMTPGDSDVTRRRAARARYVPPLGWDDIDDPTERPRVRQWRRDPRLG